MKGAAVKKMEKTFVPGRKPTRVAMWEVIPLAGNSRMFDQLGKSRDDPGTALEYRDYQGGGEIKLVWVVGR